MNERNLIGRQISTDYFTWHRGAAVGEASDLGGEFLTQVFDDAADVGFVMVHGSQRLAYTLASVERDAEGDVVAWRFSPYRPPNPRCKQAVIYND